MLTELVPAVRRALLFHAVCFYEDNPSLAGTVARFIGEGLAASQAAADRCDGVAHCLHP